MKANIFVISPINIHIYYVKFSEIINILNYVPIKSLKPEKLKKIIIIS